MSDYTPEEQTLYLKYVASRNVEWLSDSLIVARRGGRNWEKAAHMWMARFDAQTVLIGQLQVSLRRIKEEAASHFESFAHSIWKEAGAAFRLAASLNRQHAQDSVLSTDAPQADVSVEGRP